MKNLQKRSDIKTESPIEEIMFNELNRRGFHPVTQMVVGKYRIDLSFPEKMIAIECDGAIWHSTAEQQEKDRQKDIFLKENGWTVIRFTGVDIYHQADRITELIIRDYIKNNKITKTKKPDSILLNISEDLLSGEEIEDQQDYYRREEYNQQEEDYGIMKKRRFKNITEFKDNYNKPT